MKSIIPSKTAQPLCVEEIPEHLRSIYDYASQVVEYIPNRKKRVMTITRLCPRCGSSDRIQVGEIRASLRKGTLKGVCKSCFARISRAQPKGEQSRGWKGGRRLTPRGYIMVRCPEHPRAQNGYIQEHRLIMEKHLGRYLLPSETVHHKNGVKADNRIENLELWAKSHSDGARYADLAVQQLEELIAYLQHLLDAKRGS